MGVATNACFHCGEPLNGSTLQAVVGTSRQAVCCAGCQAVAELIAQVGLADYYRYREQPAQRPESSPDQWSAFDRDEIAAPFIRREANGNSSVLLLIEGVRCSACSWLIDKVLSQLDGVVDVSVNAAVGRACVQWDRARIGLGQILRWIASYGYRPQPLTDDAIARARHDESRDALKCLAVAGFGMMQVMMFAVATYSAELAGEIMDAGIWSYFRIVSLLVTTPVMLYAGAPILLGALRSVRARTMGMDIPVSIALLLAYTASVFNTWRNVGAVYFDSITMFIFFLTLGRWVEMSVRHRTASVTDALARHLPATAHRCAGERLEDVATAQLVLEDVVLIRRGEIVPADAVLLDTEAHLDESMLTGESLPVHRHHGERISAGTLNVAGPIRARVVAIGAQTLLSSIVMLLQRAQAQKPRLAQMADRAAGRFLQGVLITSVAVAAAWLYFEPAQAFATTLAVLVVACPCAFAIAMPAALAAATGELARHGVLVTRPDAIETLAKVNRVIFDKTGTLTVGELRLEHVEPLGRLSAAECAAIAAALERESEHPIARAFRELQTGSIATAVRITVGAGVEGVIGGRHYRLGTEAFAAELCGATLRPSDGRACTFVTLAGEDGMLADFVLGDTLRVGSVDVARELGTLGVSAEILSGDAPSVVTAVARTCGIDTYQGRCSPQQKLLHVRNLQSRGFTVAMLGDGINDAPVLGAANVSVAMGKGAALAQASADMILVGDDPSALVRAIVTARKTLHVARQNLYWAAAYNFGSLPLAALGFIPPWAAALGMSLSSALVMLNAMRLLHMRSPRRPLRHSAVMPPLAPIARTL